MRRPFYRGRPRRLPTGVDGRISPLVGRRDPLWGCRRPGWAEPSPLHDGDPSVSWPTPRRSYMQVPAYMAPPKPGQRRFSAACRSVIHPTRLETRTKESNMCASHWAH